MTSRAFEASFFRGAKVLVAGAAGFVGTHLTRRLVELGAEVRGTLHTKPLQREEPKVEFVSADLTRKEDCKAVCEGVDYVFMVAANSSGAAVIEKTPLVHLTPNLVMNAYMLEAAYEAKVKKYCFLSSNTVYPVTDFPVKEDDVTFQFFEKYFVVGWMKRFSELMCQMYSEKIREPMDTLVVRPGNLYGPYDKFGWNESKVIAALIRRAVERHDPLLVWGDGFDLKDFLYIDDFTTAVLSAFAKSHGPLSTFNIASSAPVNIREVLRVILEVADYQGASVEFDETKPTMIPRRLIDTSKINALTDWVPKTSLADGIRQTIEWYRKEHLRKKTKGL